MTCHFIIYNVKLGQCIGVLPHDNSEYAMMVDCGHDENFHPIDNFEKYLSKNDDQPVVQSFVLTNYDHDHFSGLPYLYSRAKIKTVLLPKNLSMDEIRALKSESTNALDTLEKIRSTYTKDVTGHTPPFKQQVFSLKKEELEKVGIPIATNHLSQVVFIKYGETTFCIPGDLEYRSWELILKKPDVQAWLRQSNILIAAHHGRENGYHKDIFKYCSPLCVIFSDKNIIHNTQTNMSTLYASHVRKSGVMFTSAKGIANFRKVLTTRNDGHILITVPRNGALIFKEHDIS